MYTPTDILQIIFFFFMGSGLIYLGIYYVKNAHKVIERNVGIMTHKDGKQSLLLRIVSGVIDTKANLYSIKLTGLVIILFGILFMGLSIAKFRNPYINSKVIKTSSLYPTLV